MLQLRRYKAHCSKFLKAYLQKSYFQNQKKNLRREWSSRSFNFLLFTITKMEAQQALVEDTMAHLKTRKGTILAKIQQQLESNYLGKNDLKCKKILTSILKGLIEKGQVEKNGKNFKLTRVTTLLKNKEDEMGIPSRCHHLRRHHDGSRRHHHHRWHHHDKRGHYKRHRHYRRWRHSRRRRHHQRRRRWFITLPSLDWFVNFNCKF